MSFASMASVDASVHMASTLGVLSVSGGLPAILKWISLLDTHNPGFFAGKSTASAEPKIATTLTTASTCARDKRFLLSNRSRIPAPPNNLILSGWHDEALPRNK